MVREKLLTAARVEEFAQGLIDSTGTIETPEGGIEVEENFDVVHTHIPGFSLLMDHGVRPDPRMSQTETVRAEINIYYARDTIIKALDRVKKPKRKSLLDMTSEIPGLRGGKDLVTGVEVQLNPEEEDIFDERLLEQSLGDRRAEVVSKPATITIHLDRDRDDVDEIERFVKRGLKRRGLSPDDVVETDKQTMLVNKNVLERLVKLGEVRLLPGTWTIQRTGEWQVKPRRVMSFSEMAEAEAAILEDLKARGETPDEK